MDEMLLRLLGQIDRLFLPTRDWTDNRSVVATWDLQQQYRTLGLPIPGDATEGSDQADRKRRERWLTEIQTSGDVVVTRRRKRRTHWRLSDATDWRLRRQAGGYGYWQTVAAMMAIAGHVKLGAMLVGTMAVDCVAEYQLAGCQPKDKPYPEASRRCRLLEDMILPALVRNWVGSASDVHGTTAYAIRPAGYQVLHDPVKHEPPAEVFTAEYSEAAEASYWVGYDDMHAELQRATPTHAGSVAVAISAGEWDWYDDRRLRPLTVFCHTGKQRSIRAIERAYRRVMR